MEFIDLKTQQKRIREKINQNINKVLDHGHYIMGGEIGELEKKLAVFTETSYAVGVASGTDALLMPLMALGIGPGDAIFTTTFTFIATAEVIHLLGATPVFVDIDEDSYNLDPQKLREAISLVLKQKKLTPKVIIPVDLFGLPADYDEINAIADEFGLMVIEDAAQSFGAMYKGKRACSLARVAATSFFPAKPLGTYGDGGMIFTSDQEMYEKLLSIRIHGKGTDKYDNIRVGINGRLDTIQAAVLLAKFEIFEEEIELRQQVSQYYTDQLKNNLKTPVIQPGYLSAWAQYSLVTDTRSDVLAALAKKGIPTAIYYPIPLHLQQVFLHLGYKKGSFPISERIAQGVFSIPMHPYLTKETQDTIIAAIKEAC